MISIIVPLRCPLCDSCSVAKYLTALGRGWKPRAVSGVIWGCRRGRYLPPGGGAWCWEGAVWKGSLYAGAGLQALLGIKS